MDSDRDNIYEVTVVASDGQEMAKRAVTVKITDSDEAGMITLSSENPVTGTPITATLEDSDGDVMNIGWQWYLLDDTQAADTASIAAAIALTGEASTAIGKATSDSYTPKAGDIGMHLVARAMYMDRTEDEDNNDDHSGIPRGSHQVRQHGDIQSDSGRHRRPGNAAPMFDEGATATRYVEGELSRREAQQASVRNHRAC